jgi:hypothetical protein
MKGAFQHALSFEDRFASPHLELIPSAVKPRTSATPFSIIVTLTILIAPVNGLSFVEFSSENEPLVSGKNKHVPL